MPKEDCASPGDAEIDEFIVQILRSTGEMTEEQLSTALAEFSRMLTTTAIVDCWRRREIAFSWNEDGLVLIKRNQEARP
ncbi:MAG: hypothetical protein GX610_09410 [Rhodococcus sp.]|nr:hypothetical protein [Rhodococcus sp. (in: high G+C Gram-positive bacteria)]